MEMRSTGTATEVSRVPWGESGRGMGIPSQAWAQMLFLPRTWLRGERGDKQDLQPRGHPQAYGGGSSLREPQGPQACPPRACQNPKIPLWGWAGAWARREQNFRNC